MIVFHAFLMCKVVDFVKYNGYVIIVEKYLRVKLAHIKHTKGEF